MRSQRRIPPAVAGWLRKADDDLEAAQILLNSGSGVHDVVCFHAQQCVEKCLKALLTFNRTAFPFVHDLGELAALLPHGLRIPLTVQEAENLSDFAVVARYPGFGTGAGLNETRHAVAVAIRVRDAVGVLVGEPAIPRRSHARGKTRR